MSQTNSIAARNSYSKGSLRMVQKDNGRIILEPTSIEDAQTLNMDELAESLDISGLSLQGERPIEGNNPYDQNPTASRAAKHWAGGGIR